MTTADPHELLAAIRSYDEDIIQNGPPQDAALRANLQQSAERLARSLENGVDLTLRVLSQAPEVLIRLGIEMGIYQCLASSQPVPFGTIANATGANISLLECVLRGQAAFGSIIYNPDVGYSLSRSAGYLTDPDFAKNFITCMDFMHSVFRELPKKLAAEAFKLP